jgi:CBS domain-containing protein
MPHPFGLPLEPKARRCIARQVSVRNDLYLLIGGVREMIIKTSTGELRRRSAPNLQCGKHWEAVMTVNDILLHKGTHVITIEPDATVAAAVRMLSKHRIGALPVTGADRRIVGIISERDIVRVLDETGPAVLDWPVAEVMTRKVVTCDRHDTIADIMQRMTGGKFRHVPVVEHGQLAGLVSIGDIVKARLDRLEYEHDAMREYILTA